MAATFKLGTLTFFQQTSAPTGWTKQTTNNDYTLRVTSGSTGGTLTNSGNFTTVLSASTMWSATVSSVSGSLTAAAADLPAHTHNVTVNSTVANIPPGQVLQVNAGSVSLAGAPSPASPTTATGSGGTNGTHAHTLSGSGTMSGGPAAFEIQYVDFILAAKA